MVRIWFMSNKTVDFTVFTVCSLLKNYDKTKKKVTSSNCKTAAHDLQYTYTSHVETSAVHLRCGALKYAVWDTAHD